MREILKDVHELTGVGGGEIKVRAESLKVPKYQKAQANWGTGSDTAKGWAGGKQHSQRVR